MGCNNTEIAENFKNQGNECFKEGKVRYKDAIEFYRKGLEQECNPTLKSTLLSNRAAVHIEMSASCPILFFLPSSALILIPPGGGALYFLCCRELQDGDG